MVLLLIATRVSCLESCWPPTLQQGLPLSDTCPGSLGFSLRPACGAAVKSARISISVRPLKSQGSNRIALMFSFQFFCRGVWRDCGQRTRDDLQPCFWACVLYTRSVGLQPGAMASKPISDVLQPRCLLWLSRLFCLCVQPTSDGLQTWAMASMASNLKAMASNLLPVFLVS